MKYIALLALLTLASCTQPVNNMNELERLNANQKALVKNTEVPVVTDSIERKNIIARTELFNNSTKISYVYLMSYWRVVSFHTVKWKVSSVSSYLTPQERIVNRWGDDCRMGNWECFIVQAPDIDGSYGTNWDGIFFFTTEWMYVEWNGEYLISDRLLKINDKTIISE